MCFKKKKKNIIVIPSKYQIDDFVRFKDPRDGVCNGYINEVKYDNDRNIVYTIQVGGECPSYRYNIKEEQIISKN